MEFLFSNSSGDYCSLTSGMSNSRKYHGLFVPMDNSKRTVVFQGIRGLELELQACGFDHASFSGKSVSCALKFPYCSRMLELSFYSDSNELKEIELIFNSRSIHSVSKGLPDINLFSNGNPGIYSLLSNGAEYVLSLHSDCADSVALSKSPHELHLEVEKQRGYEFTDTAAALAKSCFRKTLKLCFSPKLQPATHPISQFAIRKSGKTDFEKSVLHYLYFNNGMAMLSAGFHWFDSWGRDTFISLPSFARVALGNGWIKREAIISIFESYFGLLKNGLVPNYVGKDTAYNTADAPLLLVGAACEYARDFGDSGFAKSALKHTEAILNSYAVGNPNASMDSDFLIRNSAQTTWMDAIVDGNPVTPRDGKCVEINALWYNALRSHSSLCSLAGSKPSKELESLIPKIRSSFQKFWNGSYLSDRLLETGSDDRFRPNQVIAIGLGFSPVSKSHANSVLALAEKHLLTPVGLRTLSPNHPGYRHSYSGTVKQKDLAYHNGAIWPWLMYYYFRACEKTGRKPACGLEELLNSSNMLCFNHIPEVYDQAYLCPDGCVAQLWSHALIADLASRYSPRISSRI